MTPIHLVFLMFVQTPVHAGPSNFVEWVRRQLTPTPAPATSCGQPTPDEFTCGGNMLKPKSKSNSGQSRR